MWWRLLQDSSFCFNSRLFFLLSFTSFVYSSCYTSSIKSIQGKFNETFFFVSALMCFKNCQVFIAHWCASMSTLYFHLFHFCFPHLSDWRRWKKLLLMSLTMSLLKNFFFDLVDGTAGTQIWLVTTKSTFQEYFKRSRFYYPHCALNKLSDICCVRWDEMRWDEILYWSVFCSQLSLLFTASFMFSSWT